MINENEITYLCSTIAFFSFIANILLIYLTTRIRPFSRDLQLIITIAIIELMSPLISLVDPILTTIRGDDSVNDPTLCQFFGFFTVLLVHSQIIVSTFLAMERVNKMFKWNYSVKWFIPSMVSLILNLVLLIILCVKNELMSQVAKLVCLVYPSQSLLSQITFYHFLISCVIHLAVIIYCYSKLAMITNKIPAFINLDPTGRNDKNVGFKTPWNRRSVSLKVYLVLALYSINMFFGNAMYLIDTILVAYHSDNTKPQQFAIGTTGSVLFTFGFFFNSVLVMTSHTGVNHQLKLLVKSVKDKFKRNL
ncbi:hypothetical protein K502DRAFT_351737 [Neoconidiobolus thromboides FSU 785]|nr:hypothetical protein K502DRAFT_351737 [Neoconidiobolus thromboides FSU 785]